MHLIFRDKKVFPAFLVLPISAAVCFGLQSCATKPYIAKPIDRAEITQRFQSHHFSNPEFIRYLQDNQVEIAQPNHHVWGLKELALSAFYYHPSLEVARAQIALAESDVVMAGDKPKPNINAIGEYHKQKVPQGTGVWALGVGFDIPIERNNKRLARIERAQHLSMAAKLDMAATAWQLRQHVRDDLVAVQLSKQRQQLLEEDVNLRQAIVSMLEKRKSAGVGNHMELMQATLGLQRAKQALMMEQARWPELLATLAKSAGVPSSEMQRITLPTEQFSLPMPSARAKEDRQDALLNRLDLRVALERYAAAEAKLKLEIANQKPDISLAPSYVFDTSQAEQIWSLGISTLLNFLKTNGNERLIQEATALREVEAAQFYQLQTSVLQDMERAELRLTAALSEVSFAKEIELNEEKNFAVTEHRFQRGMEDRLNLTLAKLNVLQSRMQSLSARTSLEYAKAAYEDAMQRPLDEHELWANSAMSDSRESASTQNASAEQPPSTTLIDNEVIP